MRRWITVIASLLLATGCATTPSGPNATHGFGSSMAGLAHLVLSPFQIAAGLLEGIASVPYYLSTNIHDINRGMIEAQAAITLDDTYDMAYGKRLVQVPEDGDTGDTFRRMKHATEYFQKVLKSYGHREADRYILTSIDTARDDGYILLAVVYRPADRISVVDKYDRRTVRTFRSTDRLFYEPFEHTADGAPLDRIVDWAALPLEAVQTQKAQAVLLTMAANSVIGNRESPDYWEAEQEWIGGHAREVVGERTNTVRDRMKI